MLIGYDMFGFEDGLIFHTSIALSSFNKVELSNSIVDNIYITKDLSITTTTIKPEQWGYNDVLNCPFENNSLEGGSVSFNGSIIDSLLLQRRLASDLLWETVKIIQYESGTSVLFNLTDNFVQNGETYQYAIIPVSNGILGNQIIAYPDPNVIVSFDSNFLTDSTNNYQLKYDNRFDSFTSNVNTTIFEPLDSQYPIVVTNSMNYRGSRLTVTLISDTTLTSNTGVSINQEYQLRQRIASFINNRQPKLLRSMFGDNMLIMVTDKPRITFLDGNIGIASISFSFVEIGNSDVSTLALNGLVI